MRFTFSTIGTGDENRAIMGGHLRLSKRCCKHLPELQRIMRAKGSNRKKLLRASSSGCIHAICEGLTNIINKKVDLTPTQLKKVLDKEHDIWEFLDKGKSVAAKRKTLVQDGGFLGLVAPFLRMAGPLLGNIAKPLIGSIAKPLVSSLAKPLLSSFLGGLGGD